MSCLFSYLVLNLFSVVFCRLSCNFDNGFCDWRQRSINRFHWQLGSGVTEDSTSGPSSDHTTGSGQYVYVKSYDSHNSSWTAVLESPSVSIIHNTTLFFWYHMNGLGIGNLRLIAVDHAYSPQVIWSKSGRQGPDWIQAHVILTSQVIRIRFEATAREHVGSDIAIDDIVADVELLDSESDSLFSYTSEYNGITTAPSASPSPSHTVTSASPASALESQLNHLDCDFEQNTCEWRQDGHSQLNWHRWTGPSPDHSSGPDGDHTHGDGYYLLLKGHEAYHLSLTAQLLSPPITLRHQPTLKLCFSYYMNGAGIGQLRLVEVTAYGNKVLWQRQGRQGPSWKHDCVPTPVGIYMLMFEADASRHYGSDLAIDDIFVEPIHPFG